MKKTNVSLNNDEYNNLLPYHNINIIYLFAAYIQYMYFSFTHSVDSLTLV